MAVKGLAMSEIINLYRTMAEIVFRGYKIEADGYNAPTCDGKPIKVYKNQVRGKYKLKIDPRKMCPKQSVTTNNLNRRAT